MMKRLLFVVGLFSLATPLLAADPVTEQAAFFEKKIRPVLVQHCAECHSAKALAANKLKGGLRVDSREALRIGGDSGPGVVPGKPNESSLIAALKYETFEMPPKGKLPESVIADFVKWIEMGAVDPRVDDAATAVKKSIDIEAGRQFWSYRLPQPPAVPAVKESRWSRRDVDRFVLAKLEAARLQPASDADPVVLVRRVYFDLWGLPPTPEQIDEFLADCTKESDQSKDGDKTDRRMIDARSPAFEAAYSRLVDKLLASRHFGERWGRHWLDVARFAESLTLRGFVLKDAWRYRDFVIDSFNNDMPYDQFVREQIAGDLLVSDNDALEVRRRKMVATSFLAIGNSNLEEQDKKTLVMDVVDEQLETLSKAFMGQTIGCARCHDHKFDPIPTRDYYALAGILKNSKTLEHSNVSKWMEVSLPMTPDQEAVIRKHDTDLASMKKELDELKKLSKAAGTKTAKAARTVVPAPIKVADLTGHVVDDSQAKKVGAWTQSLHTKPYVADGYLHDGNGEKGEKTLTFDPDLPTTGQYEVRFAYSAGDSRSTNVPVTVFSADGEKTVLVNQQEDPPIDDVFVSLGQYRFEVGGQSFVLVSNENTKGTVTADAVVFIPVEKLTTPKPETTKSVASSSVPKKDADTIPVGDDSAAKRMKKLEDDLKSLEKSGPKRDTAVSVVEEAKIANTRIHIRGNVQTLGDEVPRGFLQVATYGTPALPSDKQSGRRELADWLASDRNPLTARVMVNRAWHWLFGAGLVRTTDNFGSTGEPPSHPELLDHLAVKYMQNGWSTKQLIRELVLSSTYRQSSDARPNQDATATADLENRLLAHANRRRIEAECIRDSMLLVSGRLKLDGNGPSFDTSLSSDFGFQHKDLFRSVYSPSFRNSPVELIEVFDAADPSTVTGKRNVSTVAPQALFLMNHPFAQEESSQAAKRLLAEPNLSDDQRIQAAYRRTLGRLPSAAEQDVSRRFIRERSANPQAAYAALLQSLFASIDFRYVR